MEATAHKARILLAEDEAIAALEIKESLEALGHSVISVTDSGDAILRAAAEAELDLVILDIHLKSFTDGIDAATRLKMLRPVPVIFITGYVDREVRERAMRVNPAAYLVKPIDSAAFAQAIQNVLSGGSPATGGPLRA
jgi:CheY-like chemotaxis protein